MNQLFGSPIAKRFLTDRELAMLAVIERICPLTAFTRRWRWEPSSDPSPVLAEGFPRRSEQLLAKNHDFVVQDRATGAIVALVEIDDYSHNAAADGKRDAMTAPAIRRSGSRGGPNRLWRMSVEEQIRPCHS